jgi:integrase
MSRGETCRSGPGRPACARSRGRAARGPYLFTAPPTRAYPDDGRQIHRPLVNRQFQRLAKMLGLPVGRAGGFALHSLRRFFKSHAENHGAPQRVFDVRLGDNSDKSMGAVYY